MDLTLDETQELIREGAHRLLAASYGPDVIREAEAAAHGFPADLWTQMAELGWTALAMPTEIGGGGSGLLELTILAEELGRAAASTPLVDSAGFAATFLQQVEPTRRSADLLSRLSTTDTIAVPALAPVPAGDPGCTIDESAGTISGAKAMVPFVSAAQMLLVSASTPDGEPAVAAVEPTADGVSWTRHEVLGGVPLFLVEFDQVGVTTDQILARGPAAEQAMAAAADAATVLAIAEAVGLCDAMTRIGAEYAANRKQFGKAIGSFQAVAHKLADMRINTDACQLLAAETAWLLDQGREATLEVAGAKVFANEVVVQTIHAAHAVHGAIGYTSEYDLQLFTRRARAFCMSHGDTDTQTERAAVALGL